MGTKLKQWPTLQLLLLSGVLFFWLSAAWPAVMTADSFDSWNQLQTNSYGDWHPVTFSLYLKLVSLNGVTPGLVSGFQLLLFSFTFYRLFKMLKPDWKLSRQLYLVSIMMALPFFGNMAVTIWKDVPYTIFSILGLILIAEGKKLSAKLNLWGVGFLALGSTFRHEGIYVLGLVLSFLLAHVFFLQIKKHSALRLRAIAKSLIVSILFSWLLSVAAVTTTKAIEMPSWPRYLSFTADLAYVAATTPEKLSPKTLSIIREISSGESLLAAKNCDTTTGIVYSPGWSGAAVEKYDDEILALWLTEVQSTAGQNLIYAHICRAAAFLPPPFSTGLRGDFWEWTWWGSEPNNIFPNLESVRSNPLLTQFEPIASGWRGLWWANGRTFAWPGLHLLISFCLVLYFRRKEAIPSSTWLLFGYLISTHLVLVVFGTAPGFRYAMATHMMSLALIGITAIHMRRMPQRDFSDKKA